MKAFIVAAAALTAASMAMAAGPAKRPSAIDHGNVVYQYNCAECHGYGPQKPGSQSLAVKYKGQNIPPVLEDRTDLTAAQIEYYTRNGVNMMPPFRKTEVGDKDLQDMIKYLTKRKR